MKDSGMKSKCLPAGIQIDRQTFIIEYIFDCSTAASSPKVRYLLSYIGA